MFYQRRNTMLNKVQLIGRLGKDPEIRYTQGSEAVATVSLATSESWKDKNGEKQEKTERHNLVFYRRLAEADGEPHVAAPAPAASAANKGKTTKAGQKPEFDGGPF